MAWNDIFPIFGDDHVEEFRAKATSQELDELENLFGVREIIAPKSAPNVLSVSLFWKPVDKGLGEVPKPSKELMQGAYEHGLVTRFHPWLHYVKPILDSPSALQLAKERLNCPDYKIRVYLAADLEFLIEDLSPYCEIYLMKSSSINFAPGGLWRFLACDNREGVSTIIDSDLLGTMSFHIEAGEKMREHGLGFWRYINIGEPWEKPETIRYLPAWGCGFGVDASKMDFSWDELLRAFVWHSWRDSFPRVANHPAHGELPVYGSEWPRYGYDEWFMIAAAYPRLAVAGVLTYFSTIGHSMCFPFDIEYVTWANPASMLVHLPYGQVKFRLAPMPDSDSEDPDSQPVVPIPAVAENLEVA